MSPCCYGKLPLYQDYLRWNAEGVEADALREWLHRGETCARAATRSGVRAEPASFRVLLFPAASGGPVAGTLRASSDAGGLRRFPFALWAPLPRGGQLPLVAAGVWEQLEALESRLVAADSVEAFYAGMRETLPSVCDLELLEERSASTTGRDLWQWSLGDAADPRRYTVLRNLEEAIAPFHASREPIGIALRVPAPERPLEAALAAAFWIALLAVRLPGRDLRPSVFHSREGQGKTLFLFLRTPEPMDYEALMEHEGHSDYIEDLLAGGGDADATALSAGTRRIAEGLFPLAELATAARG